MSNKGFLSQDVYEQMIEHSVPMRMYGVDPKIVDKKRKEIKAEKAILRQWIIEAEGVSKRKVNGFQLHHVIPLSLGGTNKRGNLVLCDQILHKAIHEFIELQEKPFRGNHRFMLVPIFNGRLWTFGPR